MKNYNKLYYLKIEIEDLKKEIENLTVLSSSKVSDMPKGSGISNPTEQYLIKKQRLIEKLNKNLEKYIDELTEMEEFISNIEDEEIRLIARHRFINNLKWEQIGMKMNYDKSVCYRKLKKYLERIKRNERRF